MDHPFFQQAVRKNYYLKSGYVSREQPRYCYDTLMEGVWQPQVYALARELGMTLRCKYVIDIGCGTASKLVKLYPDFQIIGIDYGENLQASRSMYPFGTWLEHNLDSRHKLNFEKSILKDAILVCADVIEHLVQPVHFLCNLKEWMEHAAVCLLSTPERDIEQGADHRGPPPNPSHVREWNLDELATLFRSFAFDIKFAGLTVSENITHTKRTSLLVLGNNDPYHAKSALLESREVRKNIMRII
ncbi:class I SAM-dependent methyltransferase [Cohnella ginsengisoli]|uniref:Class I SAM-dependent methyltransferase n=1 Tax=Cohnella ginsengisoli TaxID=425004 RepID=A0A9X4QP00_9BACL|nr:methyltransferase domain-containing protein [Cohnella ginsengisoli]MDG0793849.1 class I SAM-dependent methyltransferase [Cohnella ginsengisoli]